MGGGHFRDARLRDTRNMVRLAMDYSPLTLFDKVW